MLDINRFVDSVVYLDTNNRCIIFNPTSRYNQTAKVKCPFIRGEIRVSLI